jgi:C4-dicarboxylate transporter DctM subunit
MPILIIGGFRAGAFTATEAAAVAVFYALAVELFVYRDMAFGDVPSLLVKAAVRSTVVMLVVAMAALLGWMITYSGLPDQVGAFLSGISPNKYVLLLWLMVLFLIIGTFMEAYAAIILMMPILLPTLQQFEINLVHFGVIVTVNLCIGMVTPPLGLTLFVACSISGKSIAAVLRPLLPMLIAMIAVLFLITYAPETVLFLPRVMR